MAKSNTPLGVFGLGADLSLCAMRRAHRRPLILSSEVVVFTALRILKNVLKMLNLKMVRLNLSKKEATNLIEQESTIAQENITITTQATRK